MRKILILTATLAVGAAARTCTGARDLKLTNGRIVTMDPRNTIVSEVTIQNGRFTAVGTTGDTRTWGLAPEL